MARVTFLLPEKKSGLPKVGMCADLPTTQNGLWPRLATTAVRQAVGIYRSFLLRQRRYISSIPRGLNALKGFKDLSGPSWLGWPFLPFLLSQTPQSLCASSPSLGERWSDGTGNEFVIRNKMRRRHLNFPLSIFNFQFLSRPFGAGLLKYRYGCLEFQNQMRTFAVIGKVVFIDACSE